MTSSLVGSEMCIRDRYFCRYRAVQLKFFAHQHIGDALSKAVARSGVTVSYTHLTLPTICSV
eukprot:8427788-Prorocentrum_lima.AAC.1